MRCASAILERIGRDLRDRLAPRGDGTVPDPSSIRIDAVVPRRIGSFRADLEPAAHHALRDAPWIRSCVPVPPNLYFDVTVERLTELICHELTPGRDFGYVPDPALAGSRVSLAFCSPNANKPLHLGHARNMVLGTAIGNLLAFAGVDVVRSCCISDYGMHIFKALAAYLRSGAGSTPASSGEKADHFVGRFYAAYAADPTLAQGTGSPPELMRLWMEGSEEVRGLTRRLASWAEAGFDETFGDWQVRFDRRFRETQEHAYIEAFLARQTQAGRVHRDDAGRLVVALPPDGTVVPLTRSDGSPLYMSHMVAAILQRLDAFGPRVHALMALTGEEQVVPFRQLTAVLEHFGYAPSVEIRHLTHGLVRAEGRGLSSREGTALTLDQVVGDLALALDHRHVPGVPGAHTRARATLALYLLSRAVDKAIHYSRHECLRVGTRTFLLVAETLRLTGQPSADDGGPGRADDRIERWILKLGFYPVVLDRAVTRLDPSVLLNYLTELCREFVALHRAGRIDGRLLVPTGTVVRHALGLLNLPSDRYFPRGADPAPVAEPTGTRP